MKTKTIIQLTFFSLFLILMSCSKINDTGHVINANLQDEISIKKGDTLKVNLGSFGDEEGASIFRNPINAKVSKVYRKPNASSITYEYFPFENFAGKDTVTLILSRGSDGASSGHSDTTKIIVVVN